MKQLQLQVPGSFGTKEIKIELFPGKKPVLLTFFHGCCSGPYDFTPTKYQILANLLSKNLDINVAFYQSSRKVEKTQLTETQMNSFAEMAFSDKTQSDEQLDASIVMNTLQKQLNHPKIKHIFVGFSLGGLIATTLVQHYSPKLVVCFGSALGFNLPLTTPILGGGLEKEFKKQILSAAADYHNSLVVIRGTKDTTALAVESYRLFQAFTQAKTKELQEWQTVDHRFIELDGKPQEKKMIKRMYQLIKSKLLEYCSQLIEPTS